MRDGTELRKRRIDRGLTLAEVAVQHPTARTPSGIKYLESNVLYNELWEDLAAAIDAAGREKARKALGEEEEVPDGTPDE